MHKVCLDPVDLNSWHTMSDKVWIEDHLIRDDAASRYKEFDVAVVPDVIQSIDSHKHHRGVSLQRHQAWDLINLHTDTNLLS